ncbi:MAG: SdrD B-like domain-containing protein, partial [Miltoncostaeaceae bacterium]
RSPAPPQAILQTGTQVLGYNVTFGSIPTRIDRSIVDPLGIVRLGPEPIALQPSTPSPFTDAFTFNPGNGAALGRYQARVEFFSLPSGQVAPEVLAQVSFDVADQLGTLQLIKYEDANGNGVRDPGEPGVPGWSFNLINPQGNSSTAVTGPDGTVTIPSVPAGMWQVAEVIEPGWVAITPPVGPVMVPANGVGAFTAGNARPADICGVVYIDANRNGQLDSGEPRYEGATLTLGGAGTDTTASAGDGAYCFTNRNPGSYTVTVSTPGGFENTTPVTIGDIALRSATDSLNNNFGLARPQAPPAVINQAPPPRPNIRILKKAPPAAPIESVFDYRIAVRNRSSFTARDVVVTDLVPPQVTLVAIPRGATVRNGVVTWELGDMRPGTIRRMTMRVRANPTFTGVIPNTATVVAEALPPRRSTDRTRIVGRPPVPRSGGVTG